MPTAVRSPWLTIAFAVTLAAHLWGLYSPGNPGAVELFPQADKVLHFFGFALPACLAVLIFRHWWPVAAFAAHAAVSELVQHVWLPNRAGDVSDLAADLLGLVPALAVWRWVQRSSAANASGNPTSRTSAAARRPKA